MSWKTLGLTYRYPHRASPILADLSLSIPCGATVALVGANGAGKSTLLRLLAGQLHPQQGSLDWAGQAPRPHRELAFLPENPLLGVEASPLSFLRASAPLPRPKRRDLCALLGEQGLPPSGPIRRLSKGERQKLALLALRLRPLTHLLLDEPNADLDGPARQTLSHWLEAWSREGATTVMSLHHADRLPELCTHLLLLRQGRTAPLIPLKTPPQGPWELRLSGQKTPSLCPDLPALITALGKAHEGGGTVTGITPPLGLLLEGQGGAE